MDPLRIYIMTGIIIALMFISLGWNGEYVIRDIYEYNTERQCLINDEWTDVDSYLIQWGTDWYRLDGVKTYVQGKELQCSREYTKTYIKTKEVYQPGVKDIIMFWK